MNTPYRLPHTIFLNVYDRYALTVGEPGGIEFAETVALYPIPDREDETLHAFARTYLGDTLTDVDEHIASEFGHWQLVCDELTEWTDNMTGKHYIVQSLI